MAEDAAETLAWWATPGDFYEKSAEFTKDAKTAGDLALPKPVRRYLRDLEDEQARQMAEIRRKPQGA